MKRLDTLWLAGCLALGGCSVTAATASAHYLWADVKQSETGPAAWICFNEYPEPGSARLAEKAASAKAWLRAAGQDARALELKIVSDDDMAHLAARLPTKEPSSVEAKYDYGVFTHSEEPVLLHYYAQHVTADNGDELARLARSEKLPLNIVPRRDGDDLTLELLWNGQPAKECQVLVVPPKGDELELTTDAQGRATVAKAAAGNYAVRARKIEEKSGTLDGQTYGAVHHYATLTFDLPADSAATTADKMLAAARDARAVWEDFPGFTADLTINEGQDRRAGRLTITADGEVQLSGFNGMKLDRVERILESIVQHRQPGGGPNGSVSFVEEEGEHPLGPLLRFDTDKEMSSAYRVKNNVVTEVNRKMGSTRFTISVIDVQYNAEGFYLPTIFNVTFWDDKSGELKTSETHLNQWKRVGKVDLPERIVILTASDGKRDLLTLEFADHKLLSEGK